MKRGLRDSMWSLNSITSINSVMSDSSVDQVLPRAGPRSRSRRFVPASVPEEDGYLEDCDDEVLDSFIFGADELEGSAELDGEELSLHREPSIPSFHPPWIPATPTTLHAFPLSDDTCGPPSGRLSTSSTSTVSPKNLSIKAYLTEDMIISFRVPIEAKFSEIREKISDKFANDVGISLRKEYPLAFLTPARRNSGNSSVYSGIKRDRANSSTNASSLVQVQSVEDWEDIVRESNGKLILRVFE